MDFTQHSIPAMSLLNGRLLTLNFHDIRWEHPSLLDVLDMMIRPWSEIAGLVWDWPHWNPKWMMVEDVMALFWTDKKKTLNKSGRRRQCWGFWEFGTNFVRGMVGWNPHPRRPLRGVASTSGLSLNGTDVWLGMPRIWLKLELQTHQSLSDVGMTSWFTHARGLNLRWPLPSWASARDWGFKSQKKERNGYIDMKANNVSWVVYQSVENHNMSLKPMRQLRYDGLFAWPTSRFTIQFIHYGAHTSPLCQGLWYQNYGAGWCY